MNVNEFMLEIPQEWYGNLAFSNGQVTLTHPDGKGATAYELGEGDETGVKTVKNFDQAVFEAKSKINLKNTYR
jgi:hypothetical protein